MTISAMKEKKRELGLSNRQLSELSGVPVGTLQKLFSGKTKSPRRDTVEALIKILDSTGTEKAAAGNHQDSHFSRGTSGGSAPGSTAGGTAFPYSAPRETPLRLQEGTPAYRTRRFTLQDYLALPDEQRFELIDGVFYNMAAPSTLHQMISSLIQKSLLDHVMTQGGPCLPFASPVDVVLDNGQDTVVQPDVIVVCDRDKLRDGRVYGAPDLVVEVLSPSTRKKDIGLKLYKYFEAGVREYWIVDPQPRQIAVFDLEHGGTISLYGRESASGMHVPVGIWDGGHSIDFQTVFDFADPLYGL